MIASDPGEFANVIEGPPRVVALILLRGGVDGSDLLRLTETKVLDHQSRAASAIVRDQTSRLFDGSSLILWLSLGPSNTIIQYWPSGRSPLHSNCLRRDAGDGGEPDNSRDERYSFADIHAVRAG